MYIVYAGSTAIFACKNEKRAAEYVEKFTAAASYKSKLEYHLEYLAERWHRKFDSKFEKEYSDRTITNYDARNEAVGIYLKNIKTLLLENRSEEYKPHKETLELLESFANLSGRYSWSLHFHYSELHFIEHRNFE